MKAILDSLKKAARAAADRLQAWWARLRAKTTAATLKVVVTAKNIWRDHQELILWTLAWLAFGTLATLGLAGVYYTSPTARLWLEETALVIGKLVTTPLAWLKKQRGVPPAPQAPAEAVVHTVAPPPPASPSTLTASPRPTRSIPVPADKVKPPLATGGAAA